MNDYILVSDDMSIPRQVLHIIPRTETHLHNMGASNCTCNCVPVLESYYNGRIYLVIHNPLSPIGNPVSVDDITQFKQMYLLTDSQRHYLIKEQWQQK